MTLDLNDQEMKVLKELSEHCNRLGYIKFTEEDWKKFRFEKREEVVNFVLEFQEMTPEMQRMTAKEIFGEGDGEIITEEATSQDAKASVVRLIETTPNEWSQIPEKTREAAIQKLEDIEGENAAELDAAVLKKMPVELATVVKLSPEEWGELPKGVEDAILHKIDSLEEQVRKGILNSTEQNPEPDENAGLMKLARACVGGDKESCEKFQKIVEGE